MKYAIDFFQKYRKTLLVLLCVIVLILLGNYIYKKQLHRYINTYRMEKILQEAAKIPDNFWDKKYQDTPIKDKYKVHEYVVKQEKEINLSYPVKY